MKRFCWLKLCVPLVLLIGIGLTVPLQGDGSDTAGSTTVRKNTGAPMVWDDIRTNISQATVYRTKVPGGWFVHIRDQWSGGDHLITGAGSFFYPDPKHAWDGSSQPR